MYKLQNRDGEKGAVPFRTARFYNFENEWWFAIRRGTDQGPYPNEASARRALSEHIHDQIMFDRKLLQERG